MVSLIILEAASDFLSDSWKRSLKLWLVIFSLVTYHAPRGLKPVRGGSRSGHGLPGSISSRCPFRVSKKNQENMDLSALGCVVYY